MPNGLVEGLFLAAFWAPPVVVVACALTLLVKPSERTTAPIATRTPAVHH
jgi:hypothetical protein